jgi:hypothetical protein
MIYFQPACCMHVLTNDLMSEVSEKLSLCEDSKRLKNSLDWFLRGNRPSLVFLNSGKKFQTSSWGTTKTIAKGTLSS